MSNWFRTYGLGEVMDGLMIGAYPLDRDDVGMLRWMRIERVLNLVEDEEYRAGEREAVEAAFAEAGIKESRLQLIDYGGLAPDQIEAAVAQINEWLDQGVRTYMHCRAGWQRSAAVAAGVVALREGIDIDEALATVQYRKPSADPLPHQREDLRTWWEARGGAEDRQGGTGDGQGGAGDGQGGAGDGQGGAGDGQDVGDGASPSEVRD